MSDSGQGDGQRSWWEKPDADPAPQDPYRSGEEQGSGQDAHDPYRAGPASDAPTQAQPTGGSAPTEGLPRYGASSGSPGQDQSPYGRPAYDQPYGQGQPYGGQQGQSYGQQYGQQYGQPPYGGPQQNEQFPASGSHGGYGAPGYNQQYPSYDGPRVTGMAHAVCWTAVGGLVFSFTFLGWIAAIVALALTPGARREIVESGGTKRGLGYLLAGKICAWVNLGLTVLVIIGVVVFIAVGASGGFDSGSSSFDGNSVSVLFPR